MKFDVVDFYLSVLESILWKTLRFTKNYTVIEQESLCIIIHSSKSLLFCDSDTWIKKGNHMFDVTMASFDGAKVCQLLGLLLLHEIKYPFGCNSVGLCRDNGLTVLSNSFGPKTDRTRKQLIQAISRLWCENICGIKPDSDRLFGPNFEPWHWKILAI